LLNQIFKWQPLSSQFLLEAKSDGRTLSGTFLAFVPSYEQIYATATELQPLSLNLNGDCCHLEFN